MAFLLANIALAGALHFFSPVKPAIPVAEHETVKSSAVEMPSNTSIPTRTAFTFDGSSEDLNQFRQWVKKDPGAAWDWALKQPDNDRRVELLEAMCYEIAQDGDPARAVTLADNLRLADHGTLANLEQQWAEKDLTAACEWAVAKPAGDEKNELLERVAYVWASADPENAAQLVVEKMSPGNAQTEAVISVLHQWASRDFKGAMAWAELFPDGQIRQRAMNELSGVREYSLAGGTQESLPGESSR